MLVLKLALILILSLCDAHAQGLTGTGSGLGQTGVQKVTDGVTTCYPYQETFSSITSCNNGNAVIANGSGGGNGNVGIGTSGWNAYYGANGNTVNASSVIF